ncbi:hypothetical protein DFH06DRAFT_1128617 [Mycena polygramma]|nr:hypothetical protein DFH06DRAFT_1128617 [Mycena polygramma]
MSPTSIVQRRSPVSHAMDTEVNGTHCEYPADAASDPRSSRFVGTLQRDSACFFQTEIASEPKGYLAAGANDIGSQDHHFDSETHNYSHNSKACPTTSDSSSTDNTGPFSHEYLAQNLLRDTFLCGIYSARNHSSDIFSQPHQHRWSLNGHTDHIRTHITNAFDERIQLNLGTIITGGKFTVQLHDHPYPVVTWIDGSSKCTTSPVVQVESVPRRIVREAIAGKRTRAMTTTIPQPNERAEDSSDAAERRQQFIAQRIVTAQGELVALAMNGDAENTALRRQIEILQHRIQGLESELQSQWALAAVAIAFKFSSRGYSVQTKDKMVFARVDTTRDRKLHSLHPLVKRSSSAQPSAPHPPIVLLVSGRKLRAALAPNGAARTPVVAAHDVV